MAMVYLLIIFNYIFIRMCSGYDSRHDKCKYIKIRNPILRTVLMDSDSFHERIKRRKKDLDKITIGGLILHILNLITVIVSVIMSLIPKIPIQPWIIETTKFYMRVDTLNDKISALFIWSLFVGCMGYFIFYSLVWVIKFVKIKWIRVLTYIVYCFSLIMIITVLVEIIYQFFIMFA